MTRPFCSWIQTLCFFGGRLGLPALSTSYTAGSASARFQTSSRHLPRAALRIARAPHFSSSVKLYAVSLSSGGAGRMVDLLTAVSSPKIAFAGSITSFRGLSAACARNCHSR